MLDLTDLLIPVLVAAAAVFVVSSLLHMVLPLHKSDFKRLPNEDAMLALLHEHRVPPGDYVFPRCESMKDMSSPEMTAKFERGPIGVLTLSPGGGIKMGRALGQWFVLCLVTSLLIGYLATLVLPRGSAFDAVFRFTASAGILGYALSNVTDSIWKGVSWRTTFVFAFDGILYGLTTAAIFGWLWPAAAV